jgi:hypothetical protein
MVVFDTETLSGDEIATFLSSVNLEKTTRRTHGAYTYVFEPPPPLPF